MRIHMRSVVDMAATVAMLVASCAIIWAITSSQEGVPKSRPLPPPLPKDPITLEDANVLGARTASVAVIEYADFECPYCARVARRTLPEFIRKYVTSGQALLAFKHLPLPNHPLASKAAEAAECAAKQGKFWEVHDALFSEPRLTADLIGKATANASLALPEFEKCLNGGGAARVALNVREARSLKITSTPTFLIGTVIGDRRVRVVNRISGALPADALETLVVDVLSRQRSQAGSR